MTSYICPPMAVPVSHTIHDNTFWLLTQKALYWEQQKTIILADLHLGKTGHFRKEGIAVPQAVFKEDLHRLFDIIQQYKPEQLIIAGDMFHSKMNKEVDLFTRWRRDISQLPIHLVKGNHDILHSDHYAHADITVADCTMPIGKFCFVHDMNDVEGGDTSATPAAKKQPAPGGDEKPAVKKRKKATGCAPIENKESEYYYISGHIHPGVVLKTGMRQSICLPCYYFGSTYAVLPAFSAFTGTYPVSPKKNDSVFAIVKTGVIKVK